MNTWQEFLKTVPPLTTEADDGFAKAYKDYYDKKDKEAAKLKKGPTGRRSKGVNQSDVATGKKKKSSS